jgi:hypothetical protein
VGGGGNKHGGTMIARLPSSPCARPRANLASALRGEGAGVNKILEIGLKSAKCACIDCADSYQSRSKSDLK